MSISNKSIVKKIWNSLVKFIMWDENIVKDNNKLNNDVNRVSTSLSGVASIDNTSKTSDVQWYKVKNVIERKPSISEASVILKKNEWSLILWRKWILTDEQVEVIANSDEKVLDLSLFSLTNFQLELLSHFHWEEIIFWLRRITDEQADIFSKYIVNCLNLRDVLKISDYQLGKLLQLKWKKLNLRDFVPTRVQKLMLDKYQWYLINRSYSNWKELNQKIIEEQRERKRQRDESRKYKSIAYTSFQYA